MKTKDYFKFIFGRSKGLKDNESFVCTFTKPGLKNAYNYSFSNFEAADKKIEEFNKKGYNAYYQHGFSYLPGTDSRISLALGKKLIKTRNIIIDIDYKKGLDPEKVKRVLDKNNLLPTIIVSSGTGVQLIYSYKRYLNREETNKEYHKIIRKLEKCLYKTPWEIDQVPVETQSYRIPNTKNYNYDVPKDAFVYYSDEKNVFGINYKINSKEEENKLNLEEYKKEITKHKANKVFNDICPILNPIEFDFTSFNLDQSFYFSLTSQQKDISKTKKEEHIQESRDKFEELRDGLGEEQKKQIKKHKVFVDSFLEVVAPLLVNSYEWSPLGVNVLGEIFDKTKVAASKQLNKFCNIGLLERKCPDEENRYTEADMFKITEKGLKLLGMLGKAIKTITKTLTKFSRIAKKAAIDGCGQTNKAIVYLGNLCKYCEFDGDTVKSIARKWVDLFYSYTSGNASEEEIESRIIKIGSKEKK